LTAVPKAMISTAQTMGSAAEIIAFGTAVKTF
jgi:hypothetical protein